MDVAKTAAPATEAERLDIIRAELNASLGSTIEALAAAGDAYVEYQPGVSAVDGQATVDDLVAAGCITVAPITYEDFLPASAAGIFASNLTHDGAQVDDTSARLDDADRLREAVGTLHDPYALYAAQQHESLTRTLEALGLSLEEIS